MRVALHCARGARPAQAQPMPRVASVAINAYRMKDVVRLVRVQLAMPSATLPPTSTALQKAPVLLPPETEPRTLA